MGSSQAIRFVRRGAIRTLEGLDPNMTVLRYLREVERHTGTKEGCAEGDCGACTVVVGTLADGRVRYRAVNACLVLLPMLDGRQLIAVEDLAGAGRLHPVQQALVDGHGSQCGFCTPGFVMSLFALWKEQAEYDRAAVAEALAGNLCRCTGYRPIVDAALSLAGRALPDRVAEAEPAVAALLASLQRDGTFAYQAGGRRFLAPRTADALAEILEQHPDATLLAGGTDLVLRVTKQLAPFDLLVSTVEVAELRQVAAGPAGLVIGAAASYEAALPAIAAACPSFGAMIRRLGSAQIRNLGTMGGNVANGSPIGDSMPALMALGARLVLRRGRVRRELPLEDFYLGYRQTALQPGEFLESIRLPPPEPGQDVRVYKVSKRFDQDISALCGGFAVTRRDGVVAACRLCFGGMAAVPKRALAAELVLAGRPFDAAALAEAQDALAADFTPLTDMRASAAYRMQAARNLLERFWREMQGEAAPLTSVLEVVP